MLGAMAGYDPRDPASVSVPVPDFTAGLSEGIAGLRIAVDPDYALNGISSEVEAAFRRSLTTLADLGATIIDVKMPRVEAGMEAALTILKAEATAYHEQWLASRPDDYRPDVRARLEQGLAVRGVEVGRAWQTRRQLMRDFEGLFEQADLFATPMCGIPAPRLGQRQVELNGQTVPVMAPLTRFTRVFNLTGLPAISVPCGFSADGLPLGLQLAGPAFDEATVLRAARAYEAATPWRESKPLPETGRGDIAPFPTREGSSGG
jgi:aspartyl-tRNA(Asn)/glutamyl-tRNA(Gln) amidotransferase subunit A